MVIQLSFTWPDWTFAEHHSVYFTVHRIWPTWFCAVVTWQQQDVPTVTRHKSKQPMQKGARHVKFQSLVTVSSATSEIPPDQLQLKSEHRMHQQRLVRVQTVWCPRGPRTKLQCLVRTHGTADPPVRLVRAQNRSFFSSEDHKWLCPTTPQNCLVPTAQTILRSIFTW